MSQFVKKILSSKFSYLFLCVFPITLWMTIGDSQQFIARFPSGGAEQKQAIEAWSELTFSGVGFDAVAVMPKGKNKPITFGGEKEASSAIISRVMGFNARNFKDLAIEDTYYFRDEEGLPEESEKFIRNFMKKWMSGEYRIYARDGERYDLATDVVDENGQSKTINLSQFEGINWDTIDKEELEKKWTLFLDSTYDNPMSFLTPKTRMSFYKGELPHQSGDSEINFYEMKPLFGKPEKYIDGVTETGVDGWEINFRPQNSYGEFEEMIFWFKDSLRRVGADGKIKLFQAPGHQWIVFQKPAGFDRAKFSELLRAIQSLMIIDGIKGRTGIYKSNYKNVIDDNSLQNLSFSKDTMSIREGLFGRNTLALELRAGTKDPKFQSFVQRALASRISAGDFSGLAKATDYTLVPGWSFDYEVIDAYRFQEDYGVTLEEAQKCISRLNDSRVVSEDNYYAMFWNWLSPDNKMISDAKKRYLRDLTKDFIIQVSKIRENARDLDKKILDLMQSWAKTANIDEDIRKYIEPTIEYSNRARPDKFTKPRNANWVNSSQQTDVKKIDLGIEYAGRFPLRLSAERTKEGLEDSGQKVWLRTLSDHTTEEKKEILEKVANDISKALGSNAKAEYIEDGGEHGHGLSHAYEVTVNGKTWRVELDGISRNYSPTGEILEGSVRGGSIEVVTPKFVPKTKEMNAVFKAFDQNGVIPSIKSGGGHINIDLAAFEGKPKELARFIALFLEHRSMMGMMFQHPSRRHSAEQIPLPDDLINKLKNFNGSEANLKKLLYNNDFFNKRYGRKSRYTQLDLSAFFQDVIPEEFIHEDFDIKDPTTVWRRQFRVNPKIRKAEFRMFNAPRNVHEGALQVKFVRAMLAKALNDTDEIDGKIQNFTHEDYLKDPQMAKAHFENLISELGLNKKEYMYFLGQGMAETKLLVNSKFYKTLDEKFSDYPIIDDWKSASRVRRPSKALNSDGRTWNQENMLEEVKVLQRERIHTADLLESLRNEYLAKSPSRRSTRVAFKRSCMALIGGILAPLTFVMEQDNLPEYQ